MLKIGHRGASGYAPENTLSSFKHAMEMGADGIELDVHRCKSGELVVIHDDTVDRTTDGKGKVADMTLAELKALRIKDGESIPTLAEVFSAVGPNAFYFVEVKHADAALPAAAMMDACISKGWPTSKQMLISFNHEALREAHDAFPAVAIGASVEQVNEAAIQRMVAIGAQTMLPNYRMLKDLHIKYARDAGLDVITWTVNDRIDISRTRRMGLKGMMSDYPDRLG